MAEIIDWLNFAMAADTNSAVRSVAAGQAVLVQAELHRRADNSLVNEIVDLYAKARDLRQQDQLLGAFTLTLTAKEKYFSGLPGLRDAQLKMRLIDVDEKLNGELALLLDSQKREKIVAELGAFVKDVMATVPNQLQIVSSKLDKAKKMSWDRRQQSLHGVRTGIRNSWKSHNIIARYFDHAALIGPLGPLEASWRLAVTSLDNTYSPGMNDWLRQLKELLAGVEATAQEIRTERARVIRNFWIWIGVIILALVGWELLSCGKQPQSQRTISRP